MDNKRKKSEPINKDTENKLEAGVSVDQLQSDQKVLVPQLSGKLISARIWAAQIMVVILVT